MDPDDLSGAAALPWTDSGWTGPGRPRALSHAATSAETAVEALYTEHAVGLIRLAYLMLGDRPAAEDVVQDAFCSLYRSWDRLADPARALPYVRSCVLNACRSALRRRVVGRRVAPAMYAPPAVSAEAAALGRHERQEVMQAVRRLPGRQREALVLRFYLDLPDQEIAHIMGVQPSTVRSATHRALKALGQSLEKPS
jgi:RNA polymerase sigma-70 factor (sigma-E family)